MNTGIAGGCAKVLAQQNARSYPAVDDVIDELASLGYDGVDFEPLGREVRATSYNAKGQRVQAIGRTRELAAQQLVRVLRRP